MKKSLWVLRMKTAFKLTVLLTMIAVGTYIMFDSMPKSDSWAMDELRDTVEELELEGQLLDLLEALEKLEPKEPPYIEDVWIRIQNHKVEV